MVEPTVQGKHIPQCIKQAFFFDCTRQRRKGNAVAPCMWLNFFPKHVAGCCSPSDEDEHAVKRSAASLLYSISLPYYPININTNKEKQLASRWPYTAILGKAQDILDYFSTRPLGLKQAHLKLIKSTGVVLNMSYLIF